ncbi:guanylate kinase [Longimicrobium sp.]|uniref:guanylate kinase n=1 Tax=Longimicrobium sp. TaxID=2029185 RepID=UPI002E356F45|nr:guanylate kinase [Longimicrobium sp.]HEX6042736.1 guanylate kinase [Longimicrobium sp.]
MSGVPGSTFPLVLSAPSGAGKTTIAHRLRASRDDVVFSISATTRAPRERERDGIDYHFVAEDAFRRMIDAGELIEWAQVHGSYYGTPLSNVRNAQARGQFLLLDIDVQGARQIRDKVPQAVHVFVLPPSGEVLVQRLTGRGSEDEARVQRRLRNALDEIRTAGEFDHVVVNDHLDQAVADVSAILDGRTEALRPHPPLATTIAAIAHEIERHLDPA